MATNQTTGGLSILLGLFLLGITLCGFLPDFFILFAAIFSFGGVSLVFIKEESK